jgi:predicted DNA-binding transcriptional regulator AlpA
MSAGTFPKQIRLGERMVGWQEKEIDTYLERIITSSVEAS